MMHLCIIEPDCRHVHGSPQMMLMIFNHIFLPLDEIAPTAHS